MSKNMKKMISRMVSHCGSAVNMQALDMLLYNMSPFLHSPREKVNIRLRILFPIHRPPCHDHIIRSQIDRTRTSFVLLCKKHHA